MKNTINKQQLILEFVSVVFAVILALILNSWRESLSIRDDLSKVKETIRSEVIQNDSLIRQSHVYRRQLLQDLYSNQHEIMAIPTAGFPIQFEDNKALADFFRTSLIYGAKEYKERVLVLQEDSMRVLVLDQKVFDIVVENDTLRLLGTGNIQLKTPDLSTHSYSMAQATGAMVKMDIEMVERLSKVHSLIESYDQASNHAIQVIYSESQKGIIPAIEDMRSLEAQIIQMHGELLEVLK